MKSQAFRYIGVTDECIECQKCGKADLKSTVVLAILDADGNVYEVTWYGSTCAARALGIRGGGRSVLQSARWAHERTVQAAREARRRIERYGLPESGDVDRDTMMEAMRRYNRAHYDMTAIVARTGVGVRARVLDMLARDRAAIADAALLNARCGR